MSEINLSDMQKYWDFQAKSPFMQIAHCKNIKEFEERAERDVDTFLKIINPHFRNKKLKLLDLGCGIGRILKELSKRTEWEALVGVDVSEKMIRIGNSYCGNSGVELMKTNGKDLKPFGDGIFNVVYSYIVFQHMAKEIFRNYVDEVYRVLEKDGLFFFQMQSEESYEEMFGVKPEEPPVNDYRKIRFYSEKSIRVMLEDKFEILNLSKHKTSQQDYHIVLCKKIE